MDMYYKMPWYDYELIKENVIVRRRHDDEAIQHSKFKIKLGLSTL